MKELQEIYGEMQQVFAEKTGFTVEDTADLAVRLYAAAAEIQSLYVYARWALGQSFPQTAAGVYLDHHCALRGVTRLRGQKAVGTLRFRVERALEADLPVPSGTVCTTPGLVRFVTVEEGIIPAGSLYGDVRAEAEEPGAAGNVPGQTVTWLTRAPNGVVGVTNPAAFSGGADEEDDESLRKRLLDSFVRLPNGANAAFYELRALRHPGVAAVKVLPRHRGIGTVGVVIAPQTDVDGAALVEAVQSDLNVVREIAVDVTVSQAQMAEVTVSASIMPEDGVAFETAKAAVEAAIRAYFGGNLLGKTVYRAKLGQLIYGTGMVKNYALLQPTGDLAAAETVLPTLRALHITEGT